MFHMSGSPLRHVSGIWGVLVLLNFVLIHEHIDSYAHGIIMETFTPASYKTAKINQIEHTPACEGVSAHITHKGLYALHIRIPHLRT